VFALLVEFAAITGKKTLLLRILTYCKISGDLHHGKSDFEDFFEVFFGPTADKRR